MLSALIGLSTAIAYGFADFFAATAARKIQVVVVTAGASFSGLIVLCILAPIMGADFSSDAIFWGLAAGFFSVFALLALYASLALGPISIVSPLGALISAIVPAVIGVVTLGESFSATGWIAIFMALLAVVLVGFVPGVDVTLPKPRAILLAVIAGMSIGFAVTSLAKSPHDSGIAPILIMRATAALSLTAISAISLARKKRISFDGSVIPRSIWITVAGAGMLDATANILFTLGSRVGSLTEIGVLTALYPLGTILLARIVLKEHVALTQKIGIALTLAASLLLAIG